MKPSDLPPAKALKERVKELQCVYAISRLSQDNSLETQDYLCKILNIIPEGFQDVEHTCASFESESLGCQSDNFEASGTLVQQEVHFSDTEKGLLKVYLKNDQTALKEEVQMLESIAGMIEQFKRQKDTIDTLTKQQTELQNLVNSQTSYVLHTDMEGRHIYWNHKFEEDFGWIYEKGLDQSDSLLSICDYHHQRTLDTVNACFADPGSVHKVELDKPGQDGIRTTLWEFVALMDKNGQPTGIQCMGIDITKRRAYQKALEQSEARFQRIAEISQMVIWETNIEGTYTYISPVCEKIYGYTQDELIGKKTIFDLYPDHLRQTYQNEALAIIEKQEAINNYESPAIHKNGNLIWITSNASPKFDAEGTCIGYIGSDHEITARKEAEDELRKFKVIAEEATYGIAIANMDGSIDYINPAWAEMHQIGQEEAVGKPIAIFHNEEQLERVDETIVLLRRDGGFTGEEVGHTRTDGTTFPMLMSTTIITDDDEKPIFMAAVGVDYTKAVEQREQLKFKNERLQALIDAMPELIFICDKEGNYLEFYHAKDSTLYQKYAHLVGKNIRDAFDSNTAQLHLTKINQCLQNSELTAYEYPRIEEGELKYYEARTVKMDENRVLRFVREITDRKQNEAELYRLNLAIEQSPVAIIITDLNATIEYASPAFTHITGYTYEEIIGQSTRILKSNQNDAHIYENMWSNILKGNIWSGELLNKKKDGTLYWEKLTISPIYNDQGKITHFMGIKEDIDDRKKKDEEILELNASLERKVEERTKELLIAREEADTANNAKSEFLSRMSHELRTPMNAILGFAQLLQMTASEAQQVKNIKQIIKSGKHLLQLINEVLDIARIEAGRISMSLEPVEVVGLIEDMLDIVRPLSSVTQIKLSVDCDFSKLYVKTDRQRLKQVLLNLVNNAIKYNNIGGEVVVKAEIMHDQGLDLAPVKISVTDTGPGISEENQQKVFTPFERIGAENSKTEGTGLGLAVVQKLVYLMGGEIGLESTLGQGSTFWISLPQSMSQFEEHEQLNAENETGTNHGPSGTVLYVEDNRSNIELMEQILGSTRPGINLLTNHDGKDVLDQVMSYKPLLVLLDLNLPEIHGSEILQQLKTEEETKDIPVIIISADAMPKQIDQLMEIGAAAYLTKPIDVSELLQKMDEFLLP